MKQIIIECLSALQMIGHLHVDYNSPSYRQIALIQNSKNKRSFLQAEKLRGYFCSCLERKGGLDFESLYIHVRFSL